jgi:hypothetical protein
MERNLLIIILIVVIALVVLLLLSGTDPNQPITNEASPAEAYTEDNQNQSITYEHPSGVGRAESDCFDGICITRDMAGPPIITGGESKWGCGSCDSVSKWFDLFDQTLKAECIDGHMPDVVNTPLCLETSEGKWDIQFTSFESGGGGGFGYVRTEA